MSTSEGAKIVTTAIRIENVDFVDLLGSFADMMKKKTLGDLVPTGLQLFSAKTGRNVSIQPIAVSPKVTALTVFCDDPDIMEMLMRSIEKLYGKQATL